MEHFGENFYYPIENNLKDLFEKFENFENFEVK